MPPPASQSLEVTQESAPPAVHAALLEQGFGSPGRSILSTTPLPGPLDVPMPGQQTSVPSIVSALVPKPQPPPAPVAAAAEPREQATEWKEPAAARRTRNTHIRQDSRTGVHNMLQILQVSTVRLSLPYGSGILRSICLGQSVCPGFKINQ